MASYEFIKSPLFLPLFDKPAQAPILASTLANFATNKAEPRPSHKEWLRGEVGRMLRAQPGCWVHLVGHASALGDEAHNDDLSKRRVQEVEAVIRAVTGDFEGFRRYPKGEEQSGSDQTDNSDRYRSVEVIVYGPEVPKPVPPPEPRTEQRMVFRETLERQQKITEPRDIGDMDGTGGLIRTVIGVVDSTRADAARVEQHPCEAGDPDRGDVTAKRLLDINSDHVLIQVSVDKLATRHQVIVRFGGYETDTDIKRSYTFTYGPGIAGQDVFVTRHTKIVTDKGRVDLDTIESFHAGQPPSYRDP